MAKFCLITYDIPKGSGIPNPSRWFRMQGVRIAYSDWVFREDMIPYGRLHDMGERGAKWHRVPFEQGAEAEAAMQELVLHSLQHEMEKALKRARKSERNAAAAAEERGPAAYRAWVERAIRRAEAMLEGLAQGAATLGIDLDTEGTLGAIAGLQRVSQARALAYASMREQARSEGMAQATALADADAVPGEILADMIEEQGGDVEAARGAFQGTLFP